MTTPTSIPKRAPWYPSLLAACPVLALYLHNLEQLGPEVLPLPLALSMLGALACVALLAGAGLERSKAALVASLAGVFFFTFGHAWTILAVRAPPWFSHVHLLALWMASLGAAACAVAGTRRDLQRLDSFVRAVAVAGFLLLSSELAVSAFVFQSSPSRPAELRAPVRGTKAEAPAGVPDIYYVILDSYGGEATLRKLFGFSNSGFLGELRKRGFVIPADSRSNYDQTFPSLPSSLNMEYVNQHYAGGRPVARFYSLMVEMMHDCKVERFLSKRGYRCLRLGRPREQTGPDFLELLKDTTMLYFVDFGFRYRKEALATFEELSAVAGEPGPKFVFAYLLPPHWPFVFDKAGGARPESGLESSGGSVASTDTAYLDQLLYVNGRVLRAVDAILGDDRRPSVIILQGDHGPPIGNFGVPQGTIRERMDILNAYLVPKALRRQLHSGITPVNSFRLLLDYFFHAGLGLLPDESYAFEYSPSGRFMRVTEMVR